VDFKYQLFKEAVEATFGKEGVWSNDPDDRGGKTKFGITEGLWEEYLRVRKLPHKAIETLTRDEAETVYFEEFWVRPGCHLFNNEAVAKELFDTGVNCGRGSAARMAQEAYNYLRLEDWPDLKVDGQLGPISRHWINLATQRYARQMVVAMNGEQYSYYKKIKGQKFKRGWLQRVSFC